jgi:uncharacterized protein (TIGR02231 family)
LTFLGTELHNNYLKTAENDVAIRELNKKIELLNRQLNEISGTSQKMRRTIIVEVFAAKALSAQISVSYLVRGASWQPLYDARADFVKSSVELVFQAVVRQKTGEDWTDVAVSLSTARPTAKGRLPYVAPWFIRPAQPPQVVERQKYKAAWGRNSVQTMAFDAGGMAEMAPAAAFMAMPETVVQSKGIAVIYDLDRKATIKTDGQDTKLMVISQPLKADFRYSAYPRAVAGAYLGSRVANDKALQLLAGRLNVFLDGDFVGVSSIDNVSPGESFDLYLGADENVKVKREQIEKKVDETMVMGLPSPNRVTTFKFKLTVESYKNKPFKVFLFDAMPVSEDDRIKVKITNVSLEPMIKDWKDRKGVWKWELVLSLRQKQEIFYTVIVEHPKNIEVDGLLVESQSYSSSQQYEAFDL